MCTCSSQHVLKPDVYCFRFIWHYLALNGPLLPDNKVALKPWMSDGCHYETSSNLRLFLDLPMEEAWSNQAGGGRFWTLPTSSNTHNVFYLSHCSLQGFLLASTCLFCWMLWNTDVSLKYWIHPSLGCELCLLNGRVRKRGTEGRRWNLWINCYQFISFTGQSEACSAGWNWILVVVKHHKSKQREYLKVRNHFGQHGMCRMYKGVRRNCYCTIISKCGVVYKRRLFKRMAVEVAENSKQVDNQLWTIANSNWFSQIHSIPSVLFLLSHCEW